MEKKIGVYICTGCGIGDTIDAEKLSQVATEEFKAPTCRSSHSTLRLMTEGLVEELKTVRSL